MQHDLTTTAATNHLLYNPTKLLNRQRLTLGARAFGKAYSVSQYYTSISASSGSLSVSDKTSVTDELQLMQLAAAPQTTGLGQSESVDIVTANITF